jgi:hypothetical protein
MGGGRRRFISARIAGGDYHHAAVAPAARSVAVPATFPQSLLALSDRSLEAIMAAAHPIAPAKRPEFLAAVADRLSRAGEVGEGTVARCVRDLQRLYLEPPDLSHEPRWGR